MEVALFSVLVLGLHLLQLLALRPVFFFRRPCFENTVLWEQARLVKPDANPVETRVGAPGLALPVAVAECDVGPVAARSVAAGPVAARWVLGPLAAKSAQLALSKDRCWQIEQLMP